MVNKYIALIVGCWLSLGVQAEMIPFDKYRLLREGMNEAQVLLLVGKPDRESNNGIYTIVERIWYYIPERGQHDPWITTIRFNAQGKVIDIDRVRP